MKEKKEMKKKKGRKEDRKVKKKLVLEKQEMKLLLFLIYEHAVLRPQELVCRSLEMQTREAFECWKQSLMGNSDGSSEEQNVDRNMDSRGCTHEISDRNADFPGILTRDHSLYILTMSMLCSA